LFCKSHVAVIASEALVKQNKAPDPIIRNSTGLFNSTRVPGITKDTLVKGQGRHVMIQRGSDFYKLDVLNPDGSIVPVGQIQHALEHILASKVSYGSEPLGILTTMERTKWAKTRDALMESSVNKASISDIDSSLFAVCFEDHVPSSFVDQQNTMLFGGASKNRGRNRWFDKSFQLIVLPNGTAALNFEHSWGDGVAVLRYFNEVAKDAENMPATTATVAPPSPPTKLNFEVTPQVSNTIKEACKAYDGVCESVEHLVFEVPGFTANYIKSKGLGLDGVLQV